MYIMLNCIKGYAPDYSFRLYLSSPSVFAGFFRRICSGVSILAHCPGVNIQVSLIDRRVLMKKRLPMTAAF